MRNLKKLLAVVVAVCTIMAFTVPAFAADTTAAAKTDAQVVTDLGVVRGSGDGVTDAYLASQPDRLSGAIMLLRLKGLEDAAKAFTGTDNFVDATKVNADNKAILAYLKAHPELGYQGVGGNKFDPFSKLTAKQYYKLMLNALGYTYSDTDATADFSWKTVMSFAAGKGLTKLIDNEKFTVNDLAIGTVEALKATVKGGTKTLVATLAEANADFSAKAVTAGLYTVPVIALTVDSVAATDLKQVKVAFNKALDETSAETIGNYTFTGGLTVASAEMNGQIVTLTLTAPAAQQSSYDLTVKNVKDSTGAVIADTTKSIKFFDATLPTAVSAEVIGPKTIKVNFSEPITSSAITTTSNFVVDGNTYSVASVAADGLTAVDVALGSTLPAGSHSITVNNGGLTANPEIKDYAGFFVFKTVLSFTYAVDNTAPVASIDTAKQNSVKILFSKDIDPATRGNLKVYHSYNGNATYIGSLTWADNKTVTAAFASNYLPIGTVNVYVVNTSSTAQVKDLWGNVMADTTLPVTITADTTAPTVTKVEAVSATSIEVTYSEDVSGANVATNYTLKDSAAAAVAVYSAGKKANTDSTYVLTTAQLNGGAYTLTISNIKDTSVSANAMAAYTTAVSVTDLIKPTVTSPGAFSTDKKNIVVKFSEAMATSGVYSIADKNNYQISFNGSTWTDLKDITGANIAVGSGNKSVTITFATAQTSLVAGTSVVRVARVADAAGNTTASFTTDVLLNADGITATNITTNDAEKLLSGTKFEFVVDSQLSGIDVSKFTVTTSGAVAATSATYVNGATSATVTVVIPDAQKVGTDKTGLTNLTIATGGLTTVLGTSNAGTITVAASEFADYAAPEVVSTVTGDSDHDGHLDQIAITYSEPLYVASVTEADYTVEGYTIKGVVVSSNVVTLTLDELASFDTSATPKVTLVGAIADNSAQRNTLSAQAAVTATDGAAPAIVLATRTTANGITLTFSEPVYALANGTGAITTASSILLSPLGDVSDTQAALTISHTAGSITANITTTADPTVNTSTVGAAAASIYDAAGNAAAVMTNGNATETVVK